VAPVTEKHKKVHVSPLAATTSIWEKGRRYLFMVLPPAELFLAGLIDIGAGKGLKTVAIINEDALFPTAAGKGAVDLAQKKGMRVVLHETYAKGTKDFSDILARIKAANADVFGMAASSLGDFIVVVKQMKEQDIDVKMFGTSGAVAEFQKDLGKGAEFAYGLSAWEPSLPAAGPVSQGISTGDFSEALGALLGKDAAGLSASAIGHLKDGWQEEHAAWARRDLSSKRYVYVWADGIHLEARLEDEKQCILVLIGATPEGRKELVGFTDGARESAADWRDLLLDLKRRGLAIAPELVIADGALGFWKAAGEVWPKTREHRCWVHKTANVLNKLPVSQ
jgi:hypothetical protein